MTVAARAAIGILGVVNTWSTPTSKCCELLQRDEHSRQPPEPVAAETRGSKEAESGLSSCARVDAH